MSEIYDWDTDADNNNTAVPDGYPENMAPRDLNNSGRETMAVLARFFETFSGGVVTTGAANAYAVTYVQGVTSYVIGSSFTFTANHTNDGDSTLNINGIGAADIVLNNGVDVPASAIKTGGVYTVTYVTGGKFALHSEAPRLPNTVWYPWDFDASGDEVTVGLWTKPAGLKTLEVWCTGGGGGSEAGYNSGQSGSGGSACTLVGVYDGSLLPDTVDFSVGRGGVGGLLTTSAAANGSSSIFDPTDSTVARLESPGGRRSGTGAAPPTDASATTRGERSDGVYDIAGALISVTEYPSNPGTQGIVIAGENLMPPLGGTTIYGRGDTFRASNSTGGIVTAAYGAGASGVSDGNSGVRGGPGLIVITEHF